MTAVAACEVNVNCGAMIPDEEPRVAIHLDHPLLPWKSFPEVTVLRCRGTVPDDLAMCRTWQQQTWWSHPGDLHRAIGG